MRMKGQYERRAREKHMTRQCKKCKKNYKNTRNLISNFTNLVPKPKGKPCHDFKSYRS